MDFAGQRIGPYTIERLIGQGGMGSVYLASGPTGTHVALKLLHMHLTAIEEYVRRFRHEAALATKLAHPNVVRILEYGEANGQHYIAMEYVEGELLTERLERSGILVPGKASARTPDSRKANEGAKTARVGSGAASPAADIPPVRNLPLAEVFRILRQVAGVLQAAADIGLIHRDLKPQNILLDQVGNAKVLDFGLAKDTGALSSIISMTGQSIGTPPYMSPEQCEGRKEVDVRGDLYSLGATAYQMLTGRPPFRGPTHSAYIDQHRHEIPMSACKVNPAVPQNLSQVIDRLLAKKPQDRHQTPAELIEDLNRVERGEVPLKLYKPKKAPQHNPLVLWGSVAVAILVTLAFVGGWLWWRGQNVGKIIAEQVATANDLAARGDLNTALSCLDKAIASHSSFRSDPTDRSDPMTRAQVLRGELREKRIQRQTALTTEAAIACDGKDYSLAIRRYQEALTLGSTAALQQKLESAKSTKLAVETQAEAERKTHELELAQQRTAEETERQRQSDFRKALTTVDDSLGSEDRLETGLTAAEMALNLARSDDEQTKAQIAYDKAKGALKNCREWAAVVEFMVDPSVRDRTITGTAVAAKLEQQLGNRYRLVTRAQIGRALQELKFNVTDLADPEKAQQFGKFVSARQLVTGSVVQLGETLTVAAQIFTVETGAIRQTAEIEARSAEEFNAQFAELARILPMINVEKVKYMNEERNYPKFLAEGKDLAGRGRWAEAVTALQKAQAAKATAEVEALLAQAREKVETKLIVKAELNDIEIKPAVATVKVKTPLAGQSYEVPGLQLELLPISAGSFRMGEENGDSDERPVHTVLITNPFWLTQTEVTNSQYLHFAHETNYDGTKECDGDYLGHVKNPPGVSPSERHPVAFVSWLNAAAFCRWLTEREGKAGRLPTGYQYRLPTEAEWEYACRAGTTGDYAGAVDGMAWFAKNSGDKPHETGTKKPNAWGLQDMHGNVWEWCLDWYVENPLGNSSDPTGPVNGSRRVYRGGSWRRTADFCRSANRASLSPRAAELDVGFRVALAPVSTR